MENISQIIVIVGLCLILAELFLGIATGFELVLIGSILITGGFAGIATDNYVVTLVISIILSIIYIAFGRRLIKSKIIVTTHKTNIDKLIGQKAVVIRSITPDTPGLVRINDEDWRASSSDILFEKDKCTVNSVEGVTLLVSKVNNSK
jgi:membrane protein implicated in regulation of membrane protease activity